MLTHVCLCGGLGMRMLAPSDARGMRSLSELQVVVSHLARVLGS